MSYENIRKMATTMDSKLVLSMILDFVGTVLHMIPVLGTLLGLAWAPISARIMMRMYPGAAGMVAGTVSFFEELLPVVGIFPTFTIMWLLCAGAKYVPPEQMEAIKGRIGQARTTLAPVINMIQGRRQAAATA